VGVLYILDEPSIGLHSRDQRALLDTLVHLRDVGNTVIVVEHDEETMKTADWILDLGPGVLGGELVAAGTPEEIMLNPDSLTGKYLSGELKVSAPNGKHRRDSKGAQPEKRHRPLPARQPDLHHGHLGQRQIQPDRPDALPGATARPA
jgi:excinuclease ABC subunit A